MIFLPLLSESGFAIPMFAYVGPGPGLSMLGALFGLLLTLGIALWAVALWPIRAMLRKRRQHTGVE